MLAKLKLIGEPWDIGPGGYQVGGFPPGWGEWNDKYRDTVREYWKGDNVTNDFAARLLGSGDLYDLRGRRPWSSVNFITAHDGFTLNDLVSYNDKHNEPMAKIIMTGIMITAPVTMAQKGQPTTRASMRYASDRNVIS